MLPDRIVLGYHGCRRDLAERVVAGKTKLKPSSNEYDWLGRGIYFWADDPKRAIEWAKKRGFQKPGIIGAAIEVGHCLNLANRNCLEYLKKAYEHLKETCERQRIPLPENSGRYFNNRKLDCAVFETVHRLREMQKLPPFDTVAAYFIEGDELYPGAAVRALDHVQICVRNPEKIIWYFMPVGY